MEPDPRLNDMPERISRQPGGLPGIFVEGMENEQALPFIAESLAKGEVLAMRIAGQPPYGLMLRVDDANLVRKVWQSKGRSDLSKKPVTALSQHQLEDYADWKKLQEFHFSRAQVEAILSAGVHVVLPVRSGLPEHLLTRETYGPTMSVMRFREPHFRQLIEMVYQKDPSALIGGTSLNPDGKPVYLETDEVTKSLKEGHFQTVDNVIFSEAPTDLHKEGYNGFKQAHGMVALTNKGVVKIRDGFGMTALADTLKGIGLELAQKSNE